MQPLEKSSLLHDVAVVGGGPVGLAAALGFAHAGLHTALITPTPPPPGAGSEARTAALFNPSLLFLDRLGAWSDCRQPSAPLNGIRIIDETRTVLRAPELLFEAREIGQSHFGYNVPNAALGEALRAAVARTPQITWLQGTSVTAVEITPDGARADGGKSLGPRPDRAQLSLTDGRVVAARLIAAADGRGSLCRTAAGIDADIRETGQVAMTANIAHNRPHHGISTEFHRSSGPCTVVPLPGNRSSLVWIERTAVANRLLALDDTAFVAALSAQLKGLLGTISEVSARGRFDLGFVRAARLTGPRLMLMGETAHAMPPIGAQGLNLSLKDVATAVDCVCAVKASGGDLGGADVLAAYETARTSDIGMRMGAIEALNSSLLLDAGAIHLARGAGLHLLGAIGPLRRQIMRTGLGGGNALPRMMRDDAIAPTV